MISKEQFKGINLLLPYNLDAEFKNLFEYFGFTVYRPNSFDDMKNFIEKEKIDICLEWQWDRDDHTVLELVKKYKRNIPVILCLNFSNELPNNFHELGYVDYFNVPFTVDAIIKKFQRILSNYEKYERISSFSDDQYQKSGITPLQGDNDDNSVQTEVNVNSEKKLIYDSHFSFQRYIQHIDIHDLIKKNIVFEEYKNIKVEPNTKCYLCEKQILSHENLRLSDNNYLCVKCFKQLQKIKYPEKYQKLFEEYIRKCEAYDIAKNKFLSNLPYTKKIKGLNSFINYSINFFIGFIILFILSFFVIFDFLTIRLIGGTLFLFFCFSIIYVSNLIKDKLEETHKTMLENWKKKNPYPAKPELKSFYDPSAILTKRDRKILHIFNHWPGYPPFWNYLKEKIHERDNYHCQVTGCPSRTSLHVHHRIPISKGGSHNPENLVLLCAFHHAIQPDTGHARIWGNIKTDFFTLVHEHYRHNRKNSGVHSVRAHLRRLELVNLEDIKRINTYYRFLCPYCESPRLKFIINKKKSTISVICKNCGHKWEGPLELAEETGPRLAEILKPSKNLGSCKVHWEILSKRTENVWGTWRNNKKI